MHTQQYTYIRMYAYIYICIGHIYVWWNESGTLLRQAKIHQNSIKTIQFDTIHIVSGGMDHIICITDIASIQILQTLRGHTAPILSLLFDSTRICTISADNTVRYWRWGEEHDLEDKIHILAQNETLIQIAKLYNITLEELMRWNGIYDARRQVDPGIPLIVKKVRRYNIYYILCIRVYMHLYVYTFSITNLCMRTHVFTNTVNAYSYIYEASYSLIYLLMYIPPTYINRAIRTNPPKQRK